MNIWHDIGEERIFPTDFMAVIEIQKGSNMKYEMDKETGMLMLDRVLFTATHYPMNYGFIPRTYGDDKDPLDVLVIQILHSVQDILGTLSGKTENGVNDYFDVLTA